MVKVEKESGETNLFYADTSQSKLISGDKKFFCNAHNLDMLYNLLLFAVATSRYEMIKDVENPGGDKYLFVVNGKTAYCYNSFSGHSGHLTGIVDEIFKNIEESRQSLAYRIDLSGQIADISELTYEFKDMYFAHDLCPADIIIFKNIRPI